MFDIKIWLKKLGKKLAIVFIVEGLFITSNYITETQAELPPDYVHISLLLALIFSQAANFIKHEWMDN